jgi:hypothetical protein
MSQQPQELQHRRRALGRRLADRGPQPHEPARPVLDLAQARLGLAHAVHDLEPLVLDLASLRHDRAWLLRDPVHAVRDPGRLLQEGAHAVLDPAPLPRDLGPLVRDPGRPVPGLVQRRLDLGGERRWIM